MAIEKKFIQESVNRLLIKEYLQKETMRAGFGGLDIQRTPMGTRISILAERPGMIIGRRGGTINALTETLGKRFKAENPQIEVVEAGRSAALNAQIMATKLSEALERGWHFRRAGHSTVQRIMESGARGCIIIMSGKLTGQRHRTEKFIAGHIKYCGETALRVMDIGYAQCIKKIGIIGCTVKIMRPDAKLPDEITTYAPGEKPVLPGQRVHAPTPPPAPQAPKAEEKPRPKRERKAGEGAPKRERKPRPPRQGRGEGETKAPPEKKEAPPAEPHPSAEAKPAEEPASEAAAEPSAHKSSPSEPSGSSPAEEGDERRKPKASDGGET